jgi:hypothetical protein
MSYHNTYSLALIANKIPVQMHQHNAVQFVISLDNPYAAILDEVKYDSIIGFIAGPNVPHSCQSTSSIVLVISIDPLSKKGRVLINSLNGQSHVLLNSIYDSNELKYFVKSYWV